MKNYWLVAATAIALTPGLALAQGNAPEPNGSTNGPAGTVETSHAGITVDSSGAMTSTTETFKKTQSCTRLKFALSLT